MAQNWHLSEDGKTIIANDGSYTEPNYTYSFNDPVSTSNPNTMLEDLLKQNGISNTSPQSGGQTPSYGGYASFPKSTSYQNAGQVLAQSLATIPTATATTPTVTATDTTGSTTSSTNPYLAPTINYGQTVNPNSDWNNYLANRNNRRNSGSGMASYSLQEQF